MRNRKSSIQRIIVPVIDDSNESGFEKILTSNKNESTTAIHCTTKYISQRLNINFCYYHSLFIFLPQLFFTMKEETEQNSQFFEF